MLHPFASSADRLLPQRDVLCAQAARVLRTTAVHWGMCTAARAPLAAVGGLCSPRSSGRSTGQQAQPGWGGVA